MGLLTTQQAAERLGISQPRIYQLIKEKRLPAEKMGRDYFIKEKDLKLVKDRKPGRPPKINDQEKMKKKAVARWENEGGAVLPKKKGGKK